MSAIEWYFLACAGVSLFTLAFTLRNLGLFRPPPEADADCRTIVSVCIPCRNEERNIAEVVGSVLASTHTDIEVLVYDDESTDRTPEILRSLTEREARVRTVTPRQLPAGWVGKQHACHRLSEAASGEWLLFIDADVRLAPGAIGRALAHAKRTRSALVSTFPRQLTGTLGEALVVPMMFYLLLGYLPFRKMRRSLAPSASAACGQFILVERAAYTASGGHAAIRDSMHDGVKLPRRFRRAGFRTDIFDGTSLASVRMYRGFAETWRGFGKNAYEALGSVVLLAFLTVLHIGVHLAPWLALPVMLIAGGPALGIGLCALAVLAQIAQRLALTHRFGHSPALAPLHPVSVLLLTTIQWHSYMLHRRSGRAWKGRTLVKQPAPVPAQELVVLVDEHDRELGTMEKQAAHLEGGHLHRAFSVCVLDDEGRLLLQQRALSKYHFGGLWTNTCCSHPRPGEAPIEGARRRLVEEMGLDLPLEHRGSFIYRAHDQASGLTEHELDHVFVGQFTGEPSPNASEVASWRWVTMDALRAELEAEPGRFTPWLPFALAELAEFREVLTPR